MCNSMISNAALARKRRLLSQRLRLLVMALMICTIALQTPSFSAHAFAPSLAFVPAAPTRSGDHGQQPPNTKLLTISKLKIDVRMRTNRSFSDATLSALATRLRMSYATEPESPPLSLSPDAPNNTTTTADAALPTDFSLTSPPFLASSFNSSILNQTKLNSTNFDEADVPRPTQAGGFTHTRASKAKISAANKGKTPWNKGVSRTQETRLRIAEGVRRRNRERFLQKIHDMGLTEEQYNEQKKAERNRREAERRARRTPKGGYTPTNQTRAKISSVLKQRWADGLVKQRTTNTTNGRKGFSHSEETKAKISASLRKKWAEDHQYREKVSKRASEINRSVDSRQRIAQTLKKKWEDPQFRAYMMDRMSKRKRPPSSFGHEHRQKISNAMKKKWQDKEYRQKALLGIQNRTATTSHRTKLKKKLTKPRKTTNASAARKRKGTTSSTTTTTITKRTPQTKIPKKRAKKTKVKSQPIDPIIQEEDDEDEEEPELEDKELNRLRKERRDLYDLLYGDDDDDNESDVTLIDPSDEAVSLINAGRRRGRGAPSRHSKLLSPQITDETTTTTTTATTATQTATTQNLPKDTSSYVFLGLSKEMDDEDLDTFDPYGLDDY